MVAAAARDDGEASEGQPVSKELRVLAEARPPCVRAAWRSICSQAISGERCGDKKKTLTMCQWHVAWGRRVTLSAVRRCAAPVGRPLRLAAGTLWQ